MHALRVWFSSMRGLDQTLFLLRWYGIRTRLWNGLLTADLKTSEPACARQFVHPSPHEDEHHNVIVPTVDQKLEEDN